jgi:hypothetical protein
MVVLDGRWWIYFWCSSHSPGGCLRKFSSFLGEGRDVPHLDAFECCCTSKIVLWMDSNACLLRNVASCRSAPDAAPADVQPAPDKTADSAGGGMSGSGPATNVSYSSLKKIISSLVVSWAGVCFACLVDTTCFVQFRNAATDGVGVWGPIVRAPLLCKMLSRFFKPPFSSSIYYDNWFNYLGRWVESWRSAEALLSLVRFWLRR